jgi:hypothetical protein
VHEGCRNAHLFRELLRHARGCGSFGELEAAARLINERDCEPPLPWAEVGKVARSAWDVHDRGDNWVGREPRVVVRESDHLALLDRPEALTLWMLLRFEHQGLNTPFALSFALSAKAMAGAGVIPGWSARRYRKARDVLLERGFLTERHKGGRGSGDPDLFSLADRVGGKGAGSSPNTKRVPDRHPILTRHPPPRSRRSSRPRRSPEGGRCEPAIRRRPPAGGGRLVGRRRCSLGGPGDRGGAATTLPRPRPEVAVTFDRAELEGFVSGLRGVARTLVGLAQPVPPPVSTVPPGTPPAARDVTGKDSSGTPRESGRSRIGTRRPASGGSPVQAFSRGRG